MVAGAAEQYYRSLLGRWSGELTARVVAADVPASARRGWAMLAWLIRLLGPVRMETTLDAGPEPRRYFHTTRVSKWGVTLFRSEETMVVGADGIHFVIRGKKRETPSWRFASYEGTGDVDEDARAATYRIPWNGLPLVQKTQVVHEGLALTQETACSRSSVLLKRESAGVVASAADH